MRRDARKKLQLRKDTLRRLVPLDDRELASVHGGTASGIYMMMFPDGPVVGRSASASALCDAR